MKLMPERREKTAPRRSLVVLLVMFVLALIVPSTLIVVFDHPGRFSRNNYLRIHSGMSLAEVEALLGGPGEELPRASLFASPDRRAPILEGDRVFLWRAPHNHNGGQILVGLKEDRVCDKRFRQEGM